MQVNLSEDEVSALLPALDYYLAQLRAEIGKTENYDMRQSLKAQEQALRGIVLRLGGTAADTNVPDIGAKNPPWGG